MTKPVNTIKNEANESASAGSRIKGVGGAFQNVLGGNFLRREGSVRMLPYLLFLAIMVMFYIANTYHAEKKEREIQALRKELKELRYEYITTRSELMHQSQQSEVATKLLDTDIKESRVPPVKVIKKAEISHD
ncbi:MAG: FtsL-like putative cell division protein [Bacteroidales bacterium]|jgi:hypothetical protein|nr:FtsL-like putative cell division protein [Bacteroidales bacterium]